MDYQLVGRYSDTPSFAQPNKAPKIESSNSDILIKIDGEILHFVEIAYGIPYSLNGNILSFSDNELSIKENSLAIFISNKFVFISYCDSLEVRRYDGTLFKRFNGSFLYKDSLFMQTSHPSYVVDRNTHTLFVPECLAPLDFTETGEVLYQIKSQSFPGAQPTNYLVLETMKKKQIYDKIGTTLFKMMNLTLYKDTALIESPNYVTHFYIKSINDVLLPAHLILTSDAVWIICSGLVGKMELKSTMQRIVLNRMIAHNFISEYSLQELIILIGMYIPIQFNDERALEEFILKMLMERKDIEELVPKLENNIRKSNECESINIRGILCRVYRRTDDKGRKRIDKLIGANNASTENVGIFGLNNLSADDIYYIIAYLPQYMDQFIKACKKDERLFYIYDLIEFGNKTGNMEEIRKILLNNNLLFYSYTGADTLVEAERSEVNSQLLRYKSMSASEFSRLHNRKFQRRDN